MPNLFKGVVKLTEDQYKTLLQGGSFEVDGRTITYDENTLYVTDYSIDGELNVNSLNPVTNKAIAIAIENLESSMTINGVTIDTDQDISGDKNFTGEVTKNGIDLATVEQVPIVSDSLNAQYRDNALSVNQGIILNDKITTLMENVNGRVQSFSVANLEELGALFNIDTSEIKNEYVVGSTTITYKDKEYTLKTGDIFLIVDVNVPDYWFSLDDMKLFKMETMKVDLTKYVDVETDQNIGGNKTFSNQIIAPNGVKVGTDQSANNTKGVVLGNSAKIGANNDGTLAIMANNEIIIRPFFSNNAKNGIQLSSNILYPTVSNWVDLGHSSKFFRNLYLSGNLNDGTNSIAIKDIANKSSLEGLATEEYVNENGGKIDKIYLNDVEQEIVNKEVHLEIEIPEVEQITDYYKVGNKLTGIDLNTIVIPGNYGVANDCTNMPAKENGTLFVGEYDKGTYVQQLFIGTNNKVYTRNSTSVDNSTWSEWLMLARSSDLNNYLAKSGGTMTGNIVLSNLKGLVSSDGTNVIYTTGPNGTIYVGSLDKGLGFMSKDARPSFIDKNNKSTGIALLSDIPDVSGFAKTTDVNTAIANLVNSAPETLNTLGEIAEALQENETLVETLNSSIGNKVDKVSGKGLSTNDYTTTEKNKLSGIASGAEVNVQSDWNVTDTSSDAFIKNKPTIPTGAAASKGVVTSIDESANLPTSKAVKTFVEGKGYITSSGSITGNAATATNATKLNGQAASYYLNYNNFTNKPTIPTNNNQLTNGAGYITSSSLSNVDQLTTIYDKSSSNSSINKGYTSGLKGTQSLTNLSLSGYTKLRVYATCFADQINFELDLTHPVSNYSSTGFPYCGGGTCIASDDLGALYVIDCGVNSSKNTFKVLNMGYFNTSFTARNSDNEYYVTKIEGVS